MDNLAVELKLHTKEIVADNQPFQALGLKGNNTLIEVRTMPLRKKRLGLIKQSDLLPCS